MATIIALNAIVIGLETDMASFPYWDMIENAFLAIFMAELFVQIYSQGRSFFSRNHPDLLWNIFDVSVITLGVIDASMSTCLHSSHGSPATLFRIIRLLRIMRIF
eukprot:CAMPEP_0115194360 /NCGR_PEP_ID=MMETSP0270-20121206/14032_1 /TAXON_ID=71861 /ORGANISM="Scrippsiella trochoidea, Strain CCMP3099" /LENGTH=104 /DNA_ID=CAMNT_0002607663 /DNA_START=161 /DNA_END=472 /DNA_ORIENTATION=-